MDVYQVKQDRRYWVVRAEGGRFYDHFVQHGVMALGHLDETNLDARFDVNADGALKDIEAALKTLHAQKQNASRMTSSHFNQIRSFIQKISVDDWVIAVGPSAIRFGRVTSGANISNTPLYITKIRSNGEELEIAMPHTLRRQVVWGPEVSKSNIPYGMSFSLRANQTLFNVDAHREAIHHTLFPAFSIGEKLFLSISIGTSNRIKNSDVATLFQFLDEMEFYAAAQNWLNIPDIEFSLHEFLSSPESTLSTKAQFHSEGNVWLSIIKKNKHAPTILLAFSMLFGNNLIGLDGIIDKEMRHEIFHMIVERYKKHEIEKIQSNLVLETPRYETAALDAQPHKAH